MWPGGAGDRSAGARLPGPRWPACPPNRRHHPRCSTPSSQRHARLANHAHRSRSRHRRGSPGPSMGSPAAPDSTDRLTVPHPDPGRAAASHNRAATACSQCALIRRAAAVPPAPRAAAGTRAAARVNSASASVSRAAASSAANSARRPIWRDSEEREVREGAMKGCGKDDHQAMPAGQVRTLRRQDRIQLAAVQARKAPEVNTMHRLPGTQETTRRSSSSGTMPGTGPRRPSRARGEQGAGGARQGPPVAAYFARRRSCSPPGRGKNQPGKM